MRTKTPEQIRQRIRNLRLEIRRLRLLEKAAALEQAKRGSAGGEEKVRERRDLT